MATKLKAKKRKDQLLARLNEPSPETKRKISERDLNEDEQHKTTNPSQDDLDKEDASDEKAEEDQNDSLEDEATTLEGEDRERIQKH